MDFAALIQQLLLRRAQTQMVGAQKPKLSGRYQGETGSSAYGDVSQESPGGLPTVQTAPTPAPPIAPAQVQPEADQPVPWYYQLPVAVVGGLPAARGPLADAIGWNRR